KGLIFTIAASPDSVDRSWTYRLRLETEPNMAKAALLYADRARLCSMTSSALLDGLNFREFPIQHKLAFIETMAVSMAGYYDTSSISDIIERYRRAWRKRYSRDGRAQLRLLETHL